MTKAFLSFSPRFQTDNSVQPQLDVAQLQTVDHQLSVRLEGILPGDSSDTSIHYVKLKLSCRTILMSFILRKFHPACLSERSFGREVTFKGPVHPNPILIKTS